MKIVSLVLSVYLGTCCGAFAQTSAGSSTGSPAEQQAFAFQRRHDQWHWWFTRTKHIECPQSAHDGKQFGRPADRRRMGPASHGNAVDIPAAAQNLGNTDTGILKK